MHVFFPPVGQQWHSNVVQNLHVGNYLPQVKSKDLLPYCMVYVIKQQCHEDFAVLGQFCAKIITLRFNHKQNASVKLQQRYQMNFI